MIIDRVRQRQQERRQAGGGQLADGQGACAAHHQIGPGISARHVLDKRRDLRFDANRAIAFSGNCIVLLAGLMEDLRAQLGRHQRQGFGQQFVQRLGAQAAAQYQQTRLAIAQRITRGFQEQLFTHRVAGGAALVAAAEGIREGLAHAAGKWHQAAVGSAGHGILLVDDQRGAIHPRRQAAGTGDITAHAQHAHWLQFTHHLACLKQRFDQLERRFQQGQFALAAQSADVDQMQRQTRCRYQFILDTARRTQPMHAVATRFELAGAGQRREYMPAGAASHDQHITAHAEPPRRAGLRRNPTP